MENRLLFAAAVGLIGGFGLSQLYALDGRLGRLEHEPQGAPQELFAVSRRLAEVEARFGRLQDELEARDHEIEDREQELRRWRDRHTASLSESLDSRFARVDRNALERWSTVETALAEATRIAEENQGSLRQLAERAPESAKADGGELWHDLMAPTVQLAGSGTVGTGILLQSTPGDREGEWRTQVLTAWHVVRDILADSRQGEKGIPVRIYEVDGSSKEENARLVRYEAELDVALLELHSTRRLDRGAKLARRSRLESIRMFDAVYAVGCPLGNKPIPTSGAIADVHHEVDGEQYWMVSAPTYIGNSGGGIFDAETRELIGIFSKIYTHGSLRPTVVPHMGLATPLQDVYDWLDSEGVPSFAPEETEGGSMTVQAGSPAQTREP